MYVQHFGVYLVLFLTYSLAAQLTLPKTIDNLAIDLNTAVIHSQLESPFSDMTANVTCPLGMKATETGCECLPSFRHILKCSDSTFNKHTMESKILRGYWIGNASILGNQSLVAGYCKFCSSIYTSEVGNYVFLNGSSQCVANRKGTLCSECTEGTAPAVNSHHYECVPCKKFSFIWYILIEIGFLSLLILFIYIFNFFPASGALNAMVFFAQTISSTLQPNGAGFIPIQTISNASAVLVDDMLDTIYGIWNLAFINPITPPFCYFDRMNNMMSVLVMNYVLALLPLVPICLILTVRFLRQYCGRCFIPYDKCCSYVDSHIPCSPRPLFLRLTGYNQERSEQTLFATALLLSYTKFFLATLYIVTPTNLYLPNGSVAETVVYFDGRLKYFSMEHLRYAAPALCMGVSVLVSLPLSLLCLRYEKCTGDVKQNVRGWCARFAWFCSRVLDVYLLQPFQKDFRWGHKKRKPCSRVKLWKFSWGLHDYRWMAGWYFLLRFALFATFVISMSFIAQLVIQQLLCILGVVVSVSFRPYRYWLHNRIDAYIFLLLASINTLSIYQYYWTSTDQELSYWAFVVQYTIAFTPALMMAGYFFIKLVRNCQKQRLHWQEAESSDEEELQDDVDNDEGILESSNGRQTLNTAYQQRRTSSSKNSNQFLKSVDTVHRVFSTTEDQVNVAGFHPNSRESWRHRVRRKKHRCVWLCSCGDPDTVVKPAK